MNSTKEIVDKYLLENFEEIQIKRLNKKYRLGNRSSSV